MSCCGGQKAPAHIMLKERKKLRDRIRPIYAKKDGIRLTDPEIDEFKEKFIFVMRQVCCNKAKLPLPHCYHSTYCKGCCDLNFDIIYPTAMHNNRSGLATRSGTFQKYVSS